MIEYKVKSSIRWDELSQYCYGYTSNMSDLLNANPQLAIIEIIPEGSIVKIPVISGSNNTIAETLPPWKQ